MKEAYMERRSFLGGLAGVGAAYSMSAIASPQFTPKPSTEKWAVIFGTWAGTARDAGIWISEGMGGIAAVFDARQKPDLKAYDHLVIGTAIHGGKGPKEFEDFIQANLADIKDKVKGYYIVCGNGGDRPGPQAQQMYIDNYLVKLCQTSAPVSRAFPGRITKSLLSEADAKVIERFSEYDHLSRWECMEIGKQILAKSAPAKKP
jgi:menaquinone-dependent protoporphyrinogen IX oxidase